MRVRAEAILYLEHLEGPAQVGVQTRMRAIREVEARPDRVDRISLGVLRVAVLISFPIWCSIASVKCDRTLGYRSGADGRWWAMPG
jgi:hypothetical protein